MPLPEIHFLAPDIISMKNQIESFCKSLSKDDFVALVGPLGAGKTFSAQVICSYFSVRDKVTSPSFGFVNYYEGEVGIYHIDLYRMKDKGDLSFMDWDEIIVSSALKLVEWADKLEDRYLPVPRWQILIEFIEKGKGRKVNITRLERTV
ncbi:tRNA (adenosine(37)-N6)-threonylcarbamoyltransferase complex ATPase subunit type 1 TsaE [candidate division WOR-3 bacterium]|nr:tRNA (adenosine(37)-N6)-threonylcarbamoyltransferase complex ATPase subunit type 1 TsaE [candidate division WOR-3 bacterium]